MSITFSLSAHMIRPERKLTQEEVAAIIASHAKWLARAENRNTGETDGGRRADFSDADLTGFDFSGADLREANFSGSNLKDAKFAGTKLDGARFINASICNADFSRAELNGADFFRADCFSAKFTGAILTHSNLAKALLWDSDLSGADLTNSDLHAAQLCDTLFCNATLADADLSRADLDYAHFSHADCKNAIFDYTANTYWAHFDDADLTGASFYGTGIKQEDLEEAKGAFIPLSCPDEGEFVGWTKSGEGYMIKLLIPAEAERKSAANRLSRASAAKTIAIYDENGDEVSEAANGINKGCIFRPGENVESDNKGVWFFISRAEAEHMIVLPDQEDDCDDEETDEKEGKNDQD